ncbi:MAG: hypothetical protein FWD58_11085 [Firmicutes bacterium]|nr:hypothetical protein [Bacillota bacterium]
MFEALLIMSFVYAGLYLPFRGKTLNQLSESQLARLRKQYARYVIQCDRKGKPYVLEEQYISKLGTQGLIYLVVALIMVPVYIGVLFLYVMMLS